MDVRRFAPSLSKTIGLALRLSLALSFANFLPAIASASIIDDEPDVVGYDSIVNELNREVERPMIMKARAASLASDPLESIWFHAGVGATTMMETLNFDDGNFSYLALRGVQVSGGIDLFSSSWLAEGTLRNFGDNSDPSTRVNLQEFELKLVYHERFSRQLGFHAGAGLSARYMNVQRPGATAQIGQQPSRPSTYDYTTPSSVGLVGIDFFMTDRLRVGLEASAHDALVRETIDRNSLNATLRLDLQL